MIPHPDDLILSRFVDGELSENDGATVRAHLPLCAACAERVGALHGLVRALAAPAVAVDGEAEAAAVLRKIRSATREPRVAWRQRLAWGFGGALAAAASLVLFLHGAERGGQPAEFTARGAQGGSELARNVGVELKVEHAPRTARISGSYRNLMTRPAYALVFAIDARDTVHWVYPAFDDERSDPPAFSVPAGTRNAPFEDGVELESPAPGRLRLVTLISASPLHVSDVERLPAEARTSEGLRKRFPSCDLREQATVIE